MRKLIFVALFAAFMAPLPSSAQSGFDGTWKVDVQSAQFPTKPDVYLLQNGTFECKTCVPPISVKADGQDHPVSGHPYYDTVNIKIVDDHTMIETDKKNGKTVTVGKNTVSPDGKTLNFEFTDSSNSSGAPVTGKGSATRVDAGPVGSHALSGSWRMTKLENISSNGVTFTYKVDGDTLHMSSPTGQSYSAKLDGTDAPYKGDPGVTSVSVKRIDKNTIEETDKRDGKPISVARITLSADGKTLNVTSRDLLAGTSASFSAAKQ
ncbi:MAG TPA: hypothetical protein VEJ38_11610 [Candidatus Acidoferrales bacterium]|nr:hypothetical protein [Candidatus Acidoferrales bacterium]